MFDLSAFTEHHRSSIQRVISRFESDPEIQALLLTGSLAHGFAKPTSDVDVLFIIRSQDYHKRHTASELTFFDTELCSYDDGYIDGKYVDLAFIQDVASRGSEPARFAFKDAIILFSSIPDLHIHLDAAAQYPRAGKEDKIAKFYAQFEAWKWFTTEALKSDNRYLLHMASSKMILFGCRLILAHNETLFPFHKWMRRVVGQVDLKPAGFEVYLDALIDLPNLENTLAFFDLIREFREWPKNLNGWSAQFVIDSELTWQSGHVAVDDV